MMAINNNRNVKRNSLLRLSAEDKIWEPTVYSFPVFSSLTLMFEEPVTEDLWKSLIIYATMFPNVAGTTKKIYNNPSSSPSIMRYKNSMTKLNNWHRSKQSVWYSQLYSAHPIVWFSRSYVTSLLDSTRSALWPKRKRNHVNMYLNG